MDIIIPMNAEKENSTKTAKFFDFRNCRSVKQARSLVKELREAGVISVEREVYHDDLPYTKWVEPAGYSQSGFCGGGIQSSFNALARYGQDIQTFKGPWTITVQEKRTPPFQLFYHARFSKI